jgi:hypothetical protein
MPICDEQLNNGNNIKKLIFGTGDIRVNPTRPEDSEFENGISFAADTECREIGSHHSDQAGKRIDEVDTHVHMIFENIESLDVVIEELQGIRGRMVEASQQKAGS